jgi:hypothetical protein
MHTEAILLKVAKVFELYYTAGKKNTEIMLSVWASTSY